MKKESVLILNVSVKTLAMKLFETIYQTASAGAPGDSAEEKSEGVFERARLDLASRTGIKKESLIALFNLGPEGFEPTTKGL